MRIVFHWSLVLSTLTAPLLGSWSSRPAELEALVAEAFASNLALQGETLGVEQALEQLRQAQSRLQPRVDFAARYTLADGGRTIDMPVGDLLNPVYSTLNDMLVAQGRPAAFRSISNQSIALLREREQETKVRVVQPLYRPEIRHGIRARRAVWESRAIQLASYKRELRYQVETAWYRHEQASTALEILQSAKELTAEALRTNRLLFETEKVTEDRVLRAEADDLAVQQQIEEAARDRNSSRAYLNFLLNRSLRTAIVKIPAEALSAAIEHTRQLERQPAGVRGREELDALEKAVEAAEAAENAERSRQRPTLGMAVEGGIQGEEYRTGNGHNFVLGSLVAEVNLWDGRERRSAVSVARLERRRLAMQLEETRQQLEVQVERAQDELRAALASLNAAARRREASARVFELVRQREREGLATQLTFLDARNELTQAELNLSITKNRVLIAAAALDRAAALSPLP